MPALRGRTAGREARLAGITTMARFARTHEGHGDNQGTFLCFVSSVAVAYATFVIEGPA
jgi:hypothetical protein